MASATNGQDHFVKKFYFPLEPLAKTPAHNFKTVRKRIKMGLPVLIKNSGMVDSALHWDLDFLKNNCLKDENAVFFSRTKIFDLWRDCTSYAAHKKLATFVSPTRKEKMSVAAFCDRLAAWKPDQERLQLQSPLMMPIGTEMFTDMAKFDHKWLQSLQALGGWGSLVRCLLLTVAQEGNTTPAHFDRQEILFAQVRGTRRLLLFQPEMFSCLYPYPIYHPHDRQTQVDLENLDFIRFPNCAGLSGYSVQMDPGDILYVPSYWWHHAEAASEVTVSFTFAYSNKSPSKDNKASKLPMSFRQRLEIMRQTEEMMCETAGGSPDEVAAFLVDMVSGRYGSSSIRSLDKLPTLFPGDTNANSISSGSSNSNGSNNNTVSDSAEANDCVKADEIFGDASDNRTTNDHNAMAYGCAIADDILDNLCLSDANVNKTTNDSSATNDHNAMAYGSAMADEILDKLCLGDANDNSTANDDNAMTCGCTTMADDVTTNGDVKADKGIDTLCLDDTSANNDSFSI